MDNGYVRIIIDTEGSDKGPEMMIRGAAQALASHESLAVSLAGNPELIKAECEKLGILGERVEIIAASDKITNYDSPATAIFQKTDSSMVVALSSISEREDIKGMISAGNTGALIAGSMRYLSTTDRVRPALCAVLPGANGNFTCLVDTGATVDCTASMLHHFARLGRDYMREFYGIDDPKVALLSNGAESTKGNKAVKEAYALLEGDEEINFIGNFEGTRALSGECDVLVADGFAGNQVLKVSEGIARRIITDIVKYSKKTGDESIMKLVGYLMGIYDFNSLGGGMLLGIRKPVMKVHGAANEASVMNAAGMLLNMLEHKSAFDEKNHKH